MTQIPGPQQAGGLDDRAYLDYFRQLIQDVPQYAPETFAGNGNLVPIQVQKFPMLADGIFSIVVSGSPNPVWTWTEQWSAMQGATNVAWVDYDAGTIVPSNPWPGGQTVTITKRTVRWRDALILRVLNDGLRAMFPKVWTTNMDTSILLATNQWDYPLPNIFNDPGVELLKVEVQEIPATVMPFRIVQNFERVGLTTLHLPWSQGFTPGAVVRLTYAGPYESLGDLEPALWEVPALYAAGSLLIAEEAQRTRRNTMTAQTPTTATPPGTLTGAGQAQLQRFYQRCEDLKRAMPTSGWRSTYVAG